MLTNKILDPVCDMIVDVAEAREAGLTLEYPEREYGFCSAGCLAKFAKNPAAYVPKVESWLARLGDSAPATDAGSHAHAASGEHPQIDAGIRAWYVSCRCCLSDAYPAVVAVLDKELATTGEEPTAAGICETAEAHETKPS
ncbi:MAG: YHS domain-containing protein [Chloroflexi bacterium]|nr:MAG: YHS domain-containing protein [Chloroflexota bacterium]